VFTWHDSDRKSFRERWKSFRTRLRVAPVAHLESDRLL